MNVRFRLERNKSVQENGCWHWLGYIGLNGYGVIGMGQKGNRKNQRVHRVAWQEYSGKIIPEGQCVLHKCDNRKCFNPEHLFLGTNADNVRDMIQKGRKAESAGEKNGRAKLTDADIVVIRSSAGSQRMLGGRFGVSPTLIRMIKKGRIWRHIVS